MLTDPIMLVIALLTAHFFFDYAGQGEFMAKAKNASAPIPNVPWWQVLGAHAFIHGGAVALITGIWWLGLAEGAVHLSTDHAKCRNLIGFNADQAVHIISKFAWAGVALAVS